MAKTALIVDADDDARDLLTALLLFSGYSPTAASSIDEAKTHLVRREFDLMVVDEPGREAELILLAHTRTILFSRAPEAQALPVEAVLAKPFDFDQFMGLLEGPSTVPLSLDGA